MCPICAASMAWMAVGATSTGGLTAAAVKKLFRLQIPARKRRESQIRRIDRDKYSNRNRTSPSGVAS
jgi:hypothetical protein